MAIALISGASHGIDQVTALLLTQEKYTVAVNYHHNINATAEVVNTIVESGDRATALRTDISDEAQMMAMFKATDYTSEPLTTLVDNAGILFTQYMVESLSAEHVNRVLATNVTGYFLCCREAVKRVTHWHGGKDGAIINVSLAVSRPGAPGEYVDYAVSREVVGTLATRLVLGVATQGTRVSGTHPGLIYTEMHASGSESGRVDRVRSSLLMQRGGQPKEVTQATVWLLNDRVLYVTGSFLELAGGR